MDDTTTDTLNGGTPNTGEAPTAEPDALVEQELLVEEISIDGMCGVY